MRKFPWGIIAGISAMIWSIAFVAIIAVYVISSMMIAQVGGDDGLRDSWFLLPLHIGAIVSAVTSAVSWIMYHLKSGTN